MLPSWITADPNWSNVLIALSIVFGSIWAFVILPYILQKPLLWLFSDDTPRVNLKRYNFPHAGYSSTIPGFRFTTHAHDLSSATSAPPPPTPLFKFESKTRFVDRDVPLRAYSNPASNKAGVHLKRPRGVVVFFPGFGFSMNHYALLCTRIAEAGFAVHGMDFRGLGGSEGPRGHVGQYQTLVQDALSFLDHCRDKYHQSIPIFVSGHSTGASIAIICGLSRPQALKGLLLFSPLMSLNFHGYSARMRKLLPLAARILPSFKLFRFAELDMYSRNLSVADMLQNDPEFFRGKIDLQTAYELVKLCDMAAEYAPNLLLPFHIQHGTRDPIADPSGARLVFHETPLVGGPSKTLVWYHYCWHNMFLDPEAEEVIQVAVEFLEERLRVMWLASTLD